MGSMSRFGRRSAVRIVPRSSTRYHGTGLATVAIRTGYSPVRFVEPTRTIVPAGIKFSGNFFIFSGLKSHNKTLKLSLIKAKKKLRSFMSNTVKWLYCSRYGTEGKFK